MGGLRGGWCGKKAYCPDVVGVRALGHDLSGLAFEVAQVKVGVERPGAVDAQVVGEGRRLQFYEDWNLQLELVVVIGHFVVCCADYWCKSPGNCCFFVNF